MVVFMRVLFRVSVWVSTAALSIATVVLPGCSSVPDFKPSRPVEEASSLNDALDLCAAYQIKGDENPSGSAIPARTVVLVPWLRCFESVFRKFPTAKDSPSFVMLLRALQSRHDGAPTPESKVIDWPAMNFAVLHAIDHIKNPALKFADDEKRAIGQQLPDYWIYLAESGQLEAPSSTGQVRSAEVEALQREIEGPAWSPRRDEASRLPARPLPLTAEQREYCKKYVAYRAMVYNVGELAQYKSVLDERTRQDVANPNEQKMRARVDARFSALKKQAIESHRELEGELARLQKKSTWFRPGYCLQ